MDLGLVLSGGGARGAFEAGVIAALEEAGVRPTVVSGTSAGAVNAAALAVGVTAERLARLWTSLSAARVFRLRWDTYRLLRPPGRLFNPITDNLADFLLDTVGWTWMLDTQPLRRSLVQVFGSERLPLTDGTVLTVTAAETLSGRQVRFTSAAPHRPDDRFEVVDFTVDHVMSSAAIPLLFKPGEVDSRTFWDGVLVANSPAGAAFAYEPDALMVVMTSPYEGARRPPETLGDAISLLADDVLRNAVLRELGHAETVNKLVRAAPDETDKRYVEIVLVEPGDAVSGLGAFLDFNPAQARRLIELGYERGTEALKRLPLD